MINNDIKKELNNKREKQSFEDSKEKFRNKFKKDLEKSEKKDIDFSNYNSIKKINSNLNQELFIKFYFYLSKNIDTLKNKKNYKEIINNLLLIEHKKERKELNKIKDKDNLIIIKDNIDLYNDVFISVNNIKLNKNHYKLKRINKDTVKITLLSVHRNNKISKAVSDDYKSLRCYTFITRDYQKDVINSYNKNISEENKILLNETLDKIDLYKTTSVLIECINNHIINNKSTYRKLCINIETVLNNILKNDYMNLHYSFLLSKLEEKYKHSSSTHKLTSIDFTFKKLELYDETLTQFEAQKTGMQADKLLQIFINVCDDYFAINLEKQKENKKTIKTTKTIIPTLQYLKKLEKEISKEQYNNINFKAMTYKPKPWSSLNDGGYYTLKHNFIRTSQENLDIIKKEKVDLTNQYKVVNAIQESSYSIHKETLEVMKTLFNSSKEYKNKLKNNILPVIIDETYMPQRPSILDKDYDVLTEQDKELYIHKKNDYKKNMSNYYYKKASNESKFLMMKYIIDEAEYLKDEKEFFFPFNVDFRGRKYPINQIFNIQSNDYAKSLLCSSKKVKLNENSIKRFKSMGASIFGKDKISLIEQCDFIDSIEKDIIDIANNPYNNLMWMNCDDAFSFLKFCFEYNKFLNEGVEKFRTGFIYTSDGCNNGLQHYSAILKEYKTAKTCNVINNKIRQDSYQNVADILTNEFMIIQDKTQREMAKKWFNFGIDRNLLKQSVMTISYSSVKAGWHKQIKKKVKDIISKNEDKNIFNSNQELNQHISLITSSLDNIFKTEFKETINAMNLMKSNISYIFKNKKSNKDYVIYQSETGALLFQRYKKRNSKKEKYNLFNKTYEYINFFDTKEDDINKIKNGIAPNLIHNTDTTHLDKVCLAMKEKYNNTFFYAVHDSFGTTLDLADELEETIREEFIKLHQEKNIINDFIKKASEFLNVEDKNKIQYTKDLNEFDLNVVNNSEFFFKP